MAAGKDQPKLIVMNRLVIQFNRFVGRVAGVMQRGFEPYSPANFVDALEPPRRNEPRTGIVRNAFMRPLFERCAKSFMHCVFGEGEVSKKSNQRCQNPT